MHKSRILKYLVSQLPINIEFNVSISSRINAATNISTKMIFSGRAVVYRTNILLRKT